MRRKALLMVMLLVGAIFAGSIAVMANNGSDDFSDLPRDHRVGPAVYALVDQEIINGFGDRTFRFQQNITRGDAAVMIARALNYEDLNNPNVTFEDPFVDIPTTDRYFNAANWLKEQEITAGYSDGTFAPRNTITRAEMAVILSRAFDLEKTSDTYTFTDRGGSTQDFVQALYDQGITEGIGGGRFGSDNYITRGDFSVFVYRSMARGDDIPPEDDDAEEPEEFRVVDIY